MSYIAGNSRLRHKFEDVNKAITETALTFVDHAVITEGAECAIPHLTLAAAASTVRLPYEQFSSQPKDVVDFVGRTLLDRHAQSWLDERKAINWMSSDLSGQVAPLKTDGDGNCLAHAAGLAMWGLQDRRLTLRKVIHRALSESPSAELLKPRWRRVQEKQDAATALGLELDESQWEDEWKRQIVDLASARERDVGLRYASLEQFHVFVLAQILRRPVVVVANDVVEGFNGDQLQRLDIAGIYLPLLHRSDTCIRSPLMLAYFENHFVGLTWLLGPHTVPLCRQDGNRLPVVFLTEEEEPVVETLLNEYLVRCVVKQGEQTLEVASAAPTPAQVVLAPVKALAAAYAMNLTELYEEDLKARCTTPGCRSYKRQGYEVCCACSLRKPRTPSPPTTPTRCTNNSCDYFGDPSRKGLCSVCYKAQQQTRMGGRQSNASTQQTTCLSPGCKSTQILCKGFCSSCLDKMAGQWLSQSRTSTGHSSKSMQSKATMKRQATSPPSPTRRPCRTRACCYFGNADQAGFCSACFKLYHKSTFCRQDVNTPRNLQLYGSPFLPGHV